MFCLRTCVACFPCETIGAGALETREHLKTSCPVQTNSLIRLGQSVDIGNRNINNTNQPFVIRHPSFKSFSRHAILSLCHSHLFQA